MENMENRDLFMAIAAAAIVLAAVLAAGYILVTALTGGAGPAPTAVPTAVSCPTPTPYSTIPSGPFNPSGTPSNYPVVPTPVQQVNKDAELVGWGTDKDTYNRGDTAITYIIIKNTGNVPVNEAGLDIHVERYVSMIGYVPVQSPKTTLTGLNIQPGETKRAEYAITIPTDYEGLSTAGKYLFTVNVNVWDKDIGNFQKIVEVK